MPDAERWGERGAGEEAAAGLDGCLDWGVDVKRRGFLAGLVGLFAVPALPKPVELGPPTLLTCVGPGEWIIDEGPFGAEFMRTHTNALIREYVEQSGNGHWLK